MPDPYEEATIHESLAEVADARGRSPEAGEHRRRAELLYRAANAQPEADQVRSPRAR
jgi:hypothetical protein